MNIGGVEISQLRTVFNVINTTDSEANAAAVEIYNIGEDTRGQILSMDRPSLIIEAGYENVFGEIYRGKATQVFATKDRTGWVVKVSAKDGLDALRTIVNVSLAPGATMEQAFSKVAGQLGINVQEAINRIRKADFGAATKVLADGFVAFGRGFNELDRLSKKLGGEFSIQGENLQVRLPAETLSSEALLISDTTGLVGSPERVFDEERPGVLLVKFSTLILPGLKPYAKVELESREFGGTFRIEKVEFNGDTHAAQWTATVEARAV